MAGQRRPAFSTVADRTEQLAKAALFAETELLTTGSHDTTADGVAYDETNNALARGIR